MSSGGRDLGCRAWAALFAALAGGPAWGPAWAAQDADQAPTALSHHIVTTDRRIDPIFPDLHGGVWQALHGRVPPDEVRWHPTSYRPDAEGFDVTSAGAPRAAPAAPIVAPAPPVPVAPPKALAVAPPVVTPPAVIPPAPVVAPRAVTPPTPVAAAVAATSPSGKPVVARVADAPGSLPYALRPRPPIEDAIAAPAVAPVAPAHGHCLVHSNDVAVMRARLKACVTAALALSTPAAQASKR